MSLFLPRRGWLVECTTDCDPEDHPLGAAYHRHNLSLIEDGYPEVTLAGEFDPAELAGNPLVRSVREMWYFTDYDASLPDNAAGRRLTPCGIKAIMNFDRDAALADLALDEDNPVRVLWGLWQSGPAAVRPLARAVLDGDLTALPGLAAALEGTGHPDAAAVRRLTHE